MHPSSTYVKQYGCKRSGTCYTAALVAKNFPGTKVIVHGLGGKHGDPADFSQCQCDAGLREAVDAGLVRCMIAVKNPYAWVNSYTTAHVRWSKTFHEHYTRDQLDATRWCCQLWNHSNRLWAEMPKWRLFVRHEDLLEDFIGAMHRLQTELRLPKPARYVNVVHHMTPNDSESTRYFDPNPYLRKTYMQKLGLARCAEIDTHIDWELARQLGYDIGGTVRPIQPPYDKALGAPCDAK